MVFNPYPEQNHGGVGRCQGRAQDNSNAEEQDKLDEANKENKKAVDKTGRSGEKHRRKAMGRNGFKEGEENCDRYCRKVMCWEPWDLIAQFTEDLNESSFTRDVFIRREEREVMRKDNLLACVRA